MSTHSTSIFAKHPSLLHDKYVIVSADKATKNIFLYKSHYTYCLIKELGTDNSLGNPTYTSTTPTKEEILDNPMSVLCSYGFTTKDEELNLPSLYWIPNLHKCPLKQRYFAKCSMKPLSKYIQYMSLSSCNSIKTFDFSTLYTTIPHSKLTDRLRELVELCFIRKNGQRRYKYFVLGRDSFFVFL